jgi:hypothetical protein
MRYGSYSWRFSDLAYAVRIIAADVGSALIFLWPLGLPALILGWSLLGFAISATLVAIALLMVLGFEKDENDRGEDALYVSTSMLRSYPYAAIAVGSAAALWVAFVVQALLS